MMGYLKAHRFGLTHTEPTEQERQGGWKQVWEHPTGLRALRHPVTGRWVIGTGSEIVGDNFASSLKAIAAAIERRSQETGQP